MGPSQRDRNFGKELEEINQSRYRQIVKAENSLGLVLSDYIQSVKYHFRARHLFDFYIPQLIIFLSVLTVIVAILRADSGVSSNDKVKNMNNQVINTNEKWQRSAAVIGLWATWLTWGIGAHRDRHYRTLEQSSDYIKSWQSHEMKGYRDVVKLFRDQLQNKYGVKSFDARQFNEAKNTLADFKSTPGKLAMLATMQSECMECLYREDHKNVREALNEILNFVEGLGQDVKLNVADPDYLKDYFYYIVLDNYQFFRKYIESTQFTNGSRVTWCNLVYLAHTWEKEKVPPVLPAICQRPLVLTQTDLEKLKNISPESF
jgi:hypothetical protein